MRYFLEVCLKSVVAAIQNIDAEIIVVDNQSSDDSCTMVKTLFPEVNLIENKENFGFSKGNNIGVSQAKGAYVCILNPDTVVAEDTFEKLLKFADIQPKLGAVGCKLIDGTGGFLPESKRNIPTPKVALKKILGQDELYYANGLNEHSTGEVEVLVGAFMLIKREVYLAVNGFDEDYFMYGEDVDLSYKILKAGFKNYYFGDTTVIHFKGESTLRDKEYAKRFNGSMQIFYRKHFKNNVLVEQLVGLGIKGLTVLNLQPKIENRVVKSVVLISKKQNINLNVALGCKVQLKPKMEIVEDHQQYILDNNWLTFKEIIQILEQYKTNKTLTFRILSKQSNFILGSDNTVSKGIVVHF